MNSKYKFAIKFLFLIFLFSFLNMLVAEEATTKSGKKVILNENFTWKYANIGTPQNDSANVRYLKKSIDQTSLLKSKYEKYDVSYNPKIW